MQQPTKKQMHVTSNPLFAFHDDVFPAFVKNFVDQVAFPRSFGRATIIPDKFFTSLDELYHISTLEMKWNGEDSLEFKIKLLENLEASERITIIGINFFDGSTLISFGLHNNGSFWIASDYFEESMFLRSKTSELSEVAFCFKSEDVMKSLSLEIVEEQ